MKIIKFTAPIWVLFSAFAGGSPKDILNSKIARNVYLGEDFNM